MKTQMEEIKHAAVKSVDGRIFIGKHHAECFHKAHHLGVKMSQKAEDQGFLTNLEGRYVQRGQAAKIAYDAGQTELRHTILFSEYIWCEMEGGKFQYDQIKGYCEKG